MKTIQTTLFHRLVLPERFTEPITGVSTAERYPAILFLHGRGSDEEDLLGCAQELDDRFLFLSARAPLPFPYGGYTWFDMPDDRTADAAGFQESLTALSRFADDALAAYPIDPSRFFLFGFSMGTIMAYALAGTRPGVFRGVAANSGRLPEDPRLSIRWNEMGGTEFFITHGTEDPVIPVANARRAREILAAAGARFTYREYPVPHTIGNAALRDVAAWLTGILDDTEPLREPNNAPI